MADDRTTSPPISSSKLSAADVARHTFATVRRGFDPHEVRAYLDLVARELQAWEQRDEQLRQQLAAAEESARHPVLDEATLTAALGQQSAQVLRNAHDEATRLVGRAEEEAGALVREAQEQARDLRVEAESAAAARTAEAELAAAALTEQARQGADEMLARAAADAEAVRQRAAAEGESLVERATAEGESLVERAREQGRAVLLKVQEARREVLGDLAQRRRALHVQIEQFRAARDELAATVMGVRTSVDAIVSDLAHADDRARAAAAGAAAEAGAEAEPGAVPQAVEALDMADLALEEPSGPEAAREPAAPEEPATPGEEAEGSMAGTSAVDELFARIRANQPPGAPEGVVEVVEIDVVEDVVVVDAGAPDVDEDAALLELRSAVLTPIVTTLSRRLKRSLQDDQNRLLDRLRNDARGGPGELPLPGERQRQAYVETATPQLEEAFAAGAAFARELSATGAGPEPDPATVSPLADELAAEIVATLRRRLGDEGGGEDPVERVRAAYREWRGERIDRLVGDVSLGAFSEGVLAGSGGAAVRWLLAGGDGNCADCDDNSLADPVAPGAEFPTGHRHPPAHAGCRCLVVPAPG